ncbi:MAG: LysE family translocator [Formosimonas sp.]
MSWATFLLFVPACFVLNMAPGPNNVLLLNNTTRFGFKTATLAGTGRLWAFAILIVIAAVGLASVLAASASYLFALKVFGGLYLLYLAYKLCRNPVTDRDEITPQTTATRTLMRQEFICAIANPKAILIFTAIFPQFLDAQRPLALQFVIMGVTFLLLEWLTIAIYAVIGLQLARALRTAQGQRRFNRLSGGLLGLVGLAMLGSQT